MAKAARRGDLAGISCSRAHAAYGLDAAVEILLGDKRTKEILHGVLLARELLTVGKVEPFAASAGSHNGAGALASALGGRAVARVGVREASVHAGLSLGVADTPIVRARLVHMRLVPWSCL